MIFTTSFFSIIYQGNFGTQGSAYSLITGCESFIDKNGNNISATISI
ncbi:MAG: hypothetical protein AB8U25_03865 [Rickettsiales endosymbiont of Dermacentor nuttalli]